MVCPPQLSTTFETTENHYHRIEEIHRFLTSIISLINKPRAPRNPYVTNYTIRTSSTRRYRRKEQLWYFQDRLNHVIPCQVIRTRHIYARCDTIHRNQTIIDNFQVNRRKITVETTTVNSDTSLPARTPDPSFHSQTQILLEISTTPRSFSFLRFFLANRTVIIIYSC